MNVLVTGAAGFIGLHIVKKLLSQGHSVIGLDNINEYYSVQLKLDRLKELGIDHIKEGEFVSSKSYNNKFHFIKMNLQDRVLLPVIFDKFKIDVVCSLAAQAGVRYSIENPNIYIDSNIVGFANLLECMKNFEVKRLIYASSSSVYGLNEKVPFDTGDQVDRPISLYAATKKSNELIAHSYSSLFDIEVIGLRFFTVYGPWGRPDMAMFLFTDAIFNNKPIRVFNEGNLYRDFTYVSDVVDGVINIIEKKRTKNLKYSIYNIGCGNPVKLLDFIKAIEIVTKKKATIEFLPMQPGDVTRTWANTSKLEIDYKYKPKTTIMDGVIQFVDWFKTYYKN